MRWETVDHTADNEIYQLWNKEMKLLTLTLHPFSNTARVECEDEKRVFLIRKEGFLRNRTVLRNEYGIKIGELGLDNRERFIMVNNEKFYYSIDKEPLEQLVIYKETKDRPVVTCGLQVQDGTTSIHFAKNKKHLSSQPSLLMALCWYMFLPVAKRMTELA